MTCKDSGGWCLTDTRHYLLPELQIPVAVEHIWTRESKKEKSINIYLISLQLLSFSKTYRIHLSFIFMITSTLQSMVVVTSTHFTLELHWKCQYSLEKYQEAGASMEILPLKWIYENFYSLVDLLAWGKWGKSWQFELIVCFILKVIFPVHHFRDLQNRLKDSLKKKGNSI